MESQIFEIGSFIFESREMYDMAKKEEKMIQTLQSKVVLSEPKNALKVYNSLVAEKPFCTIIGYAFLIELRNFIIKTNISTSEALGEISIKEVVKQTADTLPVRPNGESRYKRLYEFQMVLNKKLKVAVIALVVFLISIVVITIRTKYSVFTYFTNYKQNMEEELINKYEEWDEDLQKRENALKSLK